MKRAFTLIELLVVIAIIAILAAILFPVFAQAKAAAKASASLSNIKQISLAAIMYSGDSDDSNVRVGNWGSTDVDNFAGYASWALQIDPYQKNIDINGSPLAGPLTKGTEIKRRVGTRLMSYGYNYTYLSPTPVSNFATGMTTTSATAFAAPAETVMFTDRAARESYGDSVYWYGANTAWIIIGTAEMPWCYNDPDVYCTDGWGTGSWYQTYVKDETNGNLTGGVAPRNSGGVNVAWLDGHAKRATTGALAAGTNWTKTTADSAVVMVDRTKYVWDNQ
jgi:prepilin-type N-terminal cleavage/methylation domain-containing protein/prepilin-type processing-associated H-X9-DG protein